MKGKTRREPTGKPLLRLMQLTERLRSGAPLSMKDRNDAAALLEQVAHDQDPRGVFFRSVTHRPKADDGGVRYAAAFVYEARVTLGEAKPGKVLIGTVSDLSGLSSSKVDHAVREYRSTVRADIGGMDRKMLVTLANTQIARLRRHRREREK